VWATAGLSGGSAMNALGRLHGEFVSEHVRG
jgi:hypothetical protein